MFDIWLKLIIFLLKIIKIVVKSHQLFKFLIEFQETFGLNLTLFNLFFLRIINYLRVKSKKFVLLSGFKIRNLRINLEKCILYRFWGAF